MAPRESDVTQDVPELRFSAARVADLLREVERLAAKETAEPLALSAAHDELDAIAFAINVIVGELAWARARHRDSLEQVAEQRREAATRAKQAGVLRDVLLSELSNGIRGSLEAMMWLARLLSSPDLSGAARASLAGRLHAHGEAVLGTFGDVLERNGLGDDGMPLSPPGAISLPDLAREVLAEVEPDIRARQLAVRFDVSSDAAHPLLTRRADLRQILASLVDKAIEYAPHGVIAVSIRVAHAEPGPEWIVEVGGGPPHWHARPLEPQPDGDLASGRPRPATELRRALRLAERLGGMAADLVVAERVNDASNAVAADLLAIRPDISLLELSADGRMAWFHRTGRPTAVLVDFSAQELIDMLDSGGVGSFADGATGGSGA